MGVLRNWFGPSKHEIWQQLSRDVGGTYVDGGYWGRDKVIAQHGEWTVTLDTYAVSTGKTVVHFTRMRAPYVNQDGFRFTIYRSGWFSELGKLLGMQDVEVGHPEFDEALVIKGNDEKKLRALFANPKIRELIQAQPTIHLAVKDDEGWFGTEFPQGVDELCFHVGGIIKDAERLKSLFALFAETLDHLCRIGSAYEDDPKVVL
jgi:hypothetical protein